MELGKKAEVPVTSQRVETEVGVVLGLDELADKQGVVAKNLAGVIQLIKQKSGFETAIQAPEKKEIERAKQLAIKIQKLNIDLAQVNSLILADLSSIQEKNIAKMAKRTPNALVSLIQNIEDNLDRDGIPKSLKQVFSSAGHDEGAFVITEVNTGEAVADS